MAEVLRFEDFELDRGTYQLRRGGRIIHLERIPLDLLFLLAAKRDQLVTREEILDQVWGKGVFVDAANSINGAVRKLRRALDDDPEAPRFIATVPAKGYRFVAPVLVPNGELKADQESAQPAPVIDASPVSQVEAKRKNRSAIGLLAAGVVIAATLALTRYAGLRLPSAAVTPQGRPAALPRLHMPSIAVLPFANLSGDPRQDYFSDGITDELITRLAQQPDLFVIARASSFAFRNKAITLQELGRLLGVRYVLEGSIRRTGNRVRITAQLADTSGGADLWAEQFDSPLPDIFAVQDVVVRKIVNTVDPQIDLQEEGIAVRQGTQNLEAYDYFLRGVMYHLGTYKHSSNKNDDTRALEMYEKALKLDPQYIDAYVQIGAVCFQDWIFGWSRDPRTLERGLESERKALALNDDNALAHAILGRLLTFKGENEEAIAEVERAVALAPFFATVQYFAAETLNFSGKPDKAMRIARNAMRLDPVNADLYEIQVGIAYEMQRRFGEALPALKRALAAYPANIGIQVCIIVCDVELGMIEQAKTEAAGILRRSPQFSFERGPSPKFPELPRWIADLRKAGLT